MFSQDNYPKPSSLLLKRLTDKNLTIHTPSHQNVLDKTIHSAPLRKLITKKTIAKKAYTVPSHSTSSQKQLFLLPFELLYDNLEQTRRLKVTLDDEIRKSSNLVQSLQSSHLIESLVRKNVHQMMNSKLDAFLDECGVRIASLEHQLSFQHIPSPAASPVALDKKKDILSQLLDRLDALESKLHS